ncbi:MAG: NAD(P)-binding protein, partial [Candidatus Lokiarchaeota archaeon]|nr:NAD(P)-binding protein [Candidatus Lokiarchaeota archaeon]
MGILNSRALLKDKYDVIIIGAGLGALTAGALLAKRGVEILIVEQQYLPGGACTSFKREDRIFDSGAALFFGFGKEGFHPERILMNSLEEELEIIPRDAFFRLDFEGNIITFYKDINKFVKELKRTFPEEKDQLEAFYNFLMDFYEKNIKGYEMLTTPSEMTGTEKLKMLIGNPIRTMNMVKLLKKSAKDIIKPYIKSKRLIEFFDMLCSSYIYCTAEETPAIMA